MQASTPEPLCFWPSKATRRRLHLMNISFIKCNLTLSAQVRSVSMVAWSLGGQLHARRIHDRVELLTCADARRSENIQTNRSSTPE